MAQARAEDLAGGHGDGLDWHAGGVPSKSRPADRDGALSRLLSRGADILSIAVGVIIGGAVLGLAGKGEAVVPSLDAWLFPVIRVDDIDGISRDADRACFTIHLTKLRDATPIMYEWHAQAPLSPPIGVAVYLVDSENRRLRLQRLEKHDVGSSWSRRYCFDMPGTLSVHDPLTMTGVAFHQRQPLWQTETAMPTFAIDATQG